MSGESEIKSEARYVPLVCIMDATILDNNNGFDCVELETEFYVIFVQTKLTLVAFGTLQALKPWSLLFSIFCKVLSSFWLGCRSLLSELPLTLFPKQNML